MAAYSGDPWREHLGLDDRRMRLMFEGVSEAYKRGLALAPGYTFGTKRKDVVLVAGHYMAYMTTKHHVSKWRLGYVARLIRKQWKTDPHWGGDWTEDLRNEVLQAAADAEPLLSTAVCRQIHADLADGQAEPSWGVEPGQYRKHAVSAGIDRVFLAASLVPQAMDRLEHDAISREPNRGLPTEDAATVTHRFLEIHPFPDFNGRTSRLLLSMWLQAKGIPFPISIRANNRWKARYGRSLRKADQGKPEEYSGLIDFAIIDGFRAIEMPVMALGCKSMFDHLVGGGPGHRRTEVEEVVAKATAALSEW